MKQRSKSSSLILIILLLIIFLPAAIGGTYYHLEHPDTGPACDLRVTPSSCYTCNNKETGYCGFAYNYIEDSGYYLNYYIGGDGAVVNIPSNYFAFIIDTNVRLQDTSNYFKGSDVYLYNTNSDTKVNLKGVKNYGIGIDDNYYIIVNSDKKYGVLSIDSVLNIIIPYEYDFIGLANHISDTGLLDNSIFAALSDGQWKLIDNGGNVLTSNFNDPIYDYNNTYVALYNSGYNIVDYVGNQALFDTYSYVEFNGDYLLVVDSSNMAYVYYLNDMSIVSFKYDVLGTDKVSLVKSESGLDLMINDEVKENIKTLE